MNNRLRFSLLAATLLATAGIGYNMYNLCEQEILWGHRPLFFFLLAWASIVLACWKKYTRHPKGLRWLGLSTLSGVLLSVSFPPFPSTILLFVAWVPLLLVEHEISQEPTIEGQKPPKLIAYTYHAFVLWNILVTWWVGNTAFIAGIVAIWLNAWFMYLPFWLFSRTKRKMPNLGYGAFIAYWLSFEMLHLHWEISWSWLNLGNAFGEFPSWVQWYEYTGTFGGSLWVLAANVLVFKLLKKMDFRPTPQKAWREHRTLLLQVKALVLLPIAVSLVMYFNETDQGREVEIVVVQPNYEPHFEKFRVPVYEKIERSLQLSEEAVTENTEYLVWPETNFNGGDYHQMPSHPIIRKLRQFLAKHPKVKLVTGIDAYKILKPGEPHHRFTRMETKGTDTLYWEAYNAAIQLQNGQDSIQFYIKSKLVPGAEIHPYHEVLFFLKPIVDKLGGTMEGFGVQPRRSAFSSDGGKVAPVICYESIFGQYHTGYIREGAEATFIMTNDGWWDDSGGHKQHLRFASLRSIETRRSTARSANTGISCFLNQRGDILQPTEYGETTAIRGKIRFNDAITFYVKWGDLIARAGLFCTIILLLNTLIRSILPPKEKAS